MSSPGFTLVSVDLDDLACYHDIYGLRPATESERAVVLTHCLPRLLDVFKETNVRATFFVIGRDLERDLACGGEGAKNLRRALQEGHELANHSYAHDYAMAEWSSADIYRDLVRCDALLRRIGARPQGFRAPGYVHHDRMLAQVAGLGYRYDSSLLPSPAYYVAKRFTLAKLARQGRRSSSNRSGWRSFLGSSRAAYRAELGLWEVPIGVSKLLRLPMVGTLLFGGPRGIASALREEAKAAPVLHLQLHGLDLGDPMHDDYDAQLVELAPELAMPYAERKQKLVEILTARGGSGTIASAIA